MTEMIKDTSTLLDAIEVEMKRGEYAAGVKPRRIIGWRGPGVVFSTRLKVPKGKSEPLAQGPVTVLTPHAQQAGWILDRIDRAFAPLLGRHIRCDFFERIAEAVMEYSAVIPLPQDSDINLLRVILREARDILGDMESGDFPHVPIED